PSSSAVPPGHASRGACAAARRDIALTHETRTHLGRATCGFGERLGTAVAAAALPLPLGGGERSGRMNRRNLRTIVSLPAALALTTRAHATAQVMATLNTFPESSPYAKAFLYSDSGFWAATGRINHDVTFTTLQYPIYGFDLWTHVVGAGSDTVFYNSYTGSVAVGTVDAAGVYHNELSFGYGYFMRGWDTLVMHRGYLFFYDKETGYAVLGPFVNGALQDHR